MFDIIYRLPIETQIALLATCRDIIKAAPLFQKTMPMGAKFKYLFTLRDVFMIGGEPRYHYHGVKKIIDYTAPPELEMKQAGRVNITIRQVYP